MNTKFGSENICTLLIILLGIGFIFPGLIPVIIVLAYLDNTLKRVYSTDYKKSIHDIIRITFGFLPIIITINLLSSMLLNDYSIQESVKSLKEEKSLHFKNIISIVILYPFIEEIYFRGILLKSLCKKIGIFWGVNLASLYFTIVHFNILASPTLFVLGLLLGIVSYISGSILFSFILHALFNLLMLLII